MIRAVLLVAFVSLLAFDARAALTMQLDVDRHVDADASRPAAPVDVHDSLVLTLRARQFVIDTPTATWVYDFGTRRRNVMDVAAHTRVDYSLYDIVGFHQLEYRNRLHIARALASAKIDTPSASRIASENSLSIEDRPSAPLRVVDDGVEKSFYDSDQVLFRVSDASTPAAPADVRMFVQMLRYRVGGHPQVLAALAAGNAIPERLVFTDVGRGTVKVAVHGLHAVDDAPVEVGTVAKRTIAASDDPVDRALDRAAALTPADIDATKQRCRAELVAALRENRLLDAVLGVAEWGLMTGDPLAPFTEEERRRLAGDPSVARLSSALGVKSPDDARAALPLLESLRPDAPRKAYVLDLFIANDRKMLGDAAGARDLFVKVLANNPAIAGAYKDLGDALLIAYDTPRAWRSWDEGRRLYPGFANFAAVNRFEKSLATEHPEYF